MAQPAPPPPVNLPLSFLCFDFGDQRVGIATGNSLLRQAQPLRTVSAQGDARWKAMGELLKQWQPNALVVGIPFHPDGAAHENTRRAQRFARQLQGRFSLPVYQVDERYSTTEALSQGARDVDAVAAAVILQQFLDGLQSPEGGPADPTMPL